ISRLPSAAASRNISACSAQAISQVGCRLMVASSANTSRPRAPAAWGDIARALATKAAMSSEADGVASGSPPALPVCAEDTPPEDLGLVGSPDMGTRGLQRVLCGPGQGSGQCVAAELIPVRPDADTIFSIGARCLPSVLDRRVQPTRARRGVSGGVS